MSGRLNSDSSRVLKWFDASFPTLPLFAILRSESEKELQQKGWTRGRSLVAAGSCGLLKNRDQQECITLFCLFCSVCKKWRSCLTFRGHLLFITNWSNCCTAPPTILVGICAFSLLLCCPDVDGTAFLWTEMHSVVFCYASEKAGWLHHVPIPGHNLGAVQDCWNGQLCFISCGSTNVQWVLTWVWGKERHPVRKDKATSSFPGQHSGGVYFSATCPKCKWAAPQHSR